MLLPQFPALLLYQPYSNIKPVQVHVQREAAFISGLHKQVSTTTRIDFGAVPQEIPVTRSFYVFNQSSFDVDLQLGVHTWEKQPGARLVDVGLQVQADGHVMLSARYSHCVVPHRSHLSTNKHLATQTVHIQNDAKMHAAPAGQGPQRQKSTQASPSSRRACNWNQA